MTEKEYLALIGAMERVLSAYERSRSFTAKLFLANEYRELRVLLMKAKKPDQEILELDQKKEEEV